MSKQHARWRPAFKWSIYGAKAMSLIHIIRPYLREKRGQADLLLEFRETKSKEHREMIKHALRRAKRPEF